MNRVFCTIALTFAVVAFVAGLQGSAQAAVIVAHVGSTDPGTEGFTLVNGGGVNGTVGPR